MSNIFLSSSLLILLIIILRTILGNHISQRLKYAIWLLVVIKLLVPLPEISSKASIMNYIDSSPIYVEKIQPVEIQDTIHINDTTNQNSISQDDILKAGSLVILSIFGISNLIFYIKLRKNRKFIKRDLLNIYESDMISSPCLYGIFPSIYVTGDTCNQYIITHEKMHFKHLDFIWVIVRVLCVSIYWYDPFVWLAAYLSRKDSELACDEAVISYLGIDQRKAYGKALMNVITHRSLYMMCSTQANSGKKEMKKRIQMIIRKPKKYILNSLICMICLILISACTLTSKNNEITKRTTLDYLDSVKEIMPEFISDKLQYVYEDNDENIISFSDVQGDPLNKASLQFDMSILNDQICSFRCAIDNFISLQSIDDHVNENQAEDIVKQFASQLLNMNVKLTFDKDLNADTSFSFQDQYHNFYSVNKQYGYLEEYDHYFENQGLSEKQKEKLLLQLNESMPKVIIDEINEKGYFYYNKDLNNISIGNSEKDPTLRLDFLYDKDNHLIQYVSKDYGFIDDLGCEEILYDDLYFEKIVKKFGKVFLNQQIEIKETKLPSTYSGNSHLKAYIDQNNHIYILNIRIGMVIYYD